LLAVTLLLMAISALMSIQGMTAIALYERPLYERRPLRPIDPDPDSFDSYIYSLTSGASYILTAAVVFFALFLIDLPYGIALGIVGTLIVVLLLALWRGRRHRRNVNRTRRSTSPRED
jgi:hypothetical protein